MKNVPFGELFSFIRNGLSVKQDKSGDGLPITRIETISAGVVDPVRVGYAGLDIVDAQAWLLRDGDILFSHINSVEHIGKCAVYRGRPAQLVHGMNLLCLRPDSQHLDSNYGQWLIRSTSFRSRLANFVNKAVNQASVSIGNLRTIRVQVPPIGEQRRIAAILDQAEALQAKRRQALAKLDTLSQSLFLEMFGATVKKIAKWPRRTLVSLCCEPDDIRCGPFGTQLLRSEFVSSGVPLWGIKHVNVRFSLQTDEFLTSKKAQVLANYSLRAGDIVMTRKGTVGNCAVYPPNAPDGVMHSDLLRLRVNQSICSPEFLAHYLHNSDDVQRQLAIISGGAVMPGINVGRLKILEVDLPPPELQSSFATRTGKIELHKSMQIAASMKSDQFFSALQQRAFGGVL